MRYTCLIIFASFSTLKRVEKEPLLQPPLSEESLPFKPEEVKGKCTRKKKLGLIHAGETLGTGVGASPRVRSRAPMNLPGKRWERRSEKLS